MAKSLIRKNQLHPDIADIIGQYGSGYFVSVESGIIFYNNIEELNLEAQFSVKITGSQNINGLKNFTQLPTVNNTPFVISGEFDLTNIVRTTGDQTIDGFKRFQIRPQVNNSGIALFDEVPKSPEFIVYTTGDQTINGQKSFTSRPQVDGVNVALVNETISLVLTGNNVVYTTGDQIIFGEKTFASKPIVKGEPVYVSGDQTPSTERYYSVFFTGKNNYPYYVTGTRNSVVSVFFETGGTGIIRLPNPYYSLDGDRVFIINDGIRPPQPEALIVEAPFINESKSGLYNLRQKLLGDNSLNQFGSDISISNDGTVFVITSPFDSQYSLDAGSASIYTGNAINGWKLKQKLFGEKFFDTASVIASNYNSDILIFGSPEYDSEIDLLSQDMGIVWVYTGNSNNGWQIRQKITGASSGAKFGQSIVANSGGNIFIVGAPFESGDNKSLVGAAIIYTGNSNNGWQIRQKISGNEAYAMFGHSVATNNDGSIVLIGSIYDGSLSGNKNIGSVFVYTGNENNGWNFKQKLTGDIFSYNFGKDIAINDDGSVLIIGSPYDNEMGVSGGATWVYTGNATNGWSKKQKFILDNKYSNFGCSISINNDGTKFLVGAPDSDTAILYTGHPVTGWGIQQKFIGNNEESFGYTVGFNKNGDIIIIGAIFNSENFDDAGAAFVYNLVADIEYSGVYRLNFPRLDENLEFIHLGGIWNYRYPALGLPFQLSNDIYLVDINNITGNFIFQNDWNGKLLTINANSNITGTVPTGLVTGYNTAFAQMQNGQLHILDCQDSTADLLINGYYLPFNGLQNNGRPSYTDGVYGVSWDSVRWILEEINVGEITSINIDTPYPWLAGFGEKQCPSGANIRQFSNLYRTAGKYAVASLIHRGDNQFLLYGDLS